MPMTSWFGCRGLAAGLALAVYTPAAAEFGSIGYPPQAVYPFGAASVSSVISIPNSDPGIHGFLLNLILPQDYKADAKVRIVVYLTTSVAKPCNMVFEPELLTRWRPGVAPGMFSTGIAPANGSNLVAFPNNNKVVAKVFTIVRDPAFPGGQRPGDALRIGLGREGGNPSDTCRASSRYRPLISDIRACRSGKDFVFGQTLHSLPSKTSCAGGAKCLHGSRLEKPSAAMQSRMSLTLIRAKNLMTSGEKQWLVCIG